MAKIVLFLLFMTWEFLAQAAVVQSDLVLLNQAEEQLINPDLDLAWHGRLASYGEPDSQFFVAQVYEEGKLVPRNLKKAIEFYRRAAEQGHLESCICLAHLLPEEAIHWYELAAQQNDPQAQIKLSQLYEAEGNLEKAIFWLETALHQLFPEVSDLTAVSPDLKRLKAPQ